MNPFFAYMITITIIASMFAIGVSVANWLHFRDTEKKLRNLGDR